MPSVGMRTLVPPVVSSPMPHGLLSGCVEVVTTRDVHELNGTDVMSSGCTPAHAWQDCAEAGTDPVTGPYVNPATKTFDRAGNLTFEPITAYVGAECSTIGVSWDEMRSRALDSLAMGEEAVLEEFVASRLLAPLAMDADLTPAGGGIASVVAGVGLLEGWLAANYGGTGVIHAPARAGSALSAARVAAFPSPDACPVTLAGNTVVLGGGYEDAPGPYTAPLEPGDVAGPGQAWLYITPAMRIRRDAPYVVQTDEWQAIDTAVNDWRVIAEATFVPELACPLVAAVLVDLGWGLVDGA